LACQVSELGVAVLVLSTFGDLGVGLQAEALRTQHPCHRAVRHCMAQLGQRIGQVLGRLGRPHQQRHRIAPRLGIHQRLELGRELRVGLGQLLATATGGAHPAPRLGRTLHLAHPTGHRIGMDTGRVRHRLHPTATELGGLAPQQQTTLPLIQMRTQHRVPACQRLRHLPGLGHSTTVRPANTKT